jgi:anthranilate synthase/aminodeoxychorismate synthase-like glutamine amidotransferase
MILVIDNYDSFTYNLVQLLSELGGDVMVRRNDEVGVADIARLGPAGIVISPGPGAPDDAGVSVDVIRRFGSTVPVLGVCLGHQAIGVAYGARVTRARRPVHGKVSAVSHAGVGPFRGLDTPVDMTRYHSLVVALDGLPPELEVIGWATDPEDGAEIQGLRHREHPVWGVQFHPESVASRDGARLLANFLELTR